MCFPCNYTCISMCLSYRAPYFSMCVHHRRLMKAQLKVAEEAAGKAAQLRAEAAEFRGNPTGNVPFFMGKITGNRLAICYMNHSGNKNLKKLVRRHETNLGMLKVKLTHSPKLGKFWDMSSQISESFRPWPCQLHPWAGGAVVAKSSAGIADHHGISVPVPVSHGWLYMAIYTGDEWRYTCI